MTNESKRRRLSRPYPQFPLKDIERIPKLIHSARNGNIMDSEKLAKAMSKTPKSSEYIMMINAAIAYGLVSGKYNTEITVLPLAEKIIAPKNETERKIGLVEAALNPQTFQSLRELIQDEKLPKDSYMKNILEREIDIHHDLTEECLRIFKENSEYANIFNRQESLKETEKSEIPENTLVESKETRTKQTLIYITQKNSTAEKIKTLYESLGLNCISINEQDVTENELTEEIKRKLKLCNSAIIEKNEDKISHQIFGAVSVLYDEKVIIVPESNFETHEFINKLKSKNIIEISQK